MDTTYLAYLAGPQLIGVLFVILGIIQRYLPPKNINNWYGYRTAKARSSQEMWKEGNKYSADFMVKAGMIVFFIGLMIKSVLILMKADAEIQKTAGYIILFGGALGIGVLMTIVTEKHLKTFKPKQATKKRK
jgi:hypothetical protein